MANCCSSAYGANIRTNRMILLSNHFTDNLEALFRNVPPPLSLALAMTEKHEKAARAEIMRERDCSELEAVYVIAERIELARR